MEVCNSPLWDTSLTWDTEQPDFTACFQKTVLVYLPAVYLLVLLPLDIYFSQNSLARRIPWSPLNVFRLLLTGCLIIVGIAEGSLLFVSEDVLNIADIIAPVVKIVFFSIAIGLGLFNMKMGIQSSGIMFGFWTLTSLCCAVTFASVVRFGDQGGQTSSGWVASLDFGLSLSVFFLHFFADPEPVDKSLEFQTDKPSPELSASFPSYLTFTWFDKIIRLGWKRPLTKDDLYDLKLSEKTSVIFPKWNKNWEDSVEKDKMKHSNKETSILIPIFKTFGIAFLTSSIVQLFTVLLTQVSPQALNLLIGFISSDEEMWKGYLYMAFLVTLNLTKTLLNSQYFKEQTLIGLRIRSAMTSALFRKSLKLSSKSRKERSVGETVNLMQLDTQRIMNVIMQLNLIWSSPVTIVLSIYSLWGLVGPSCLAGLLVMVLLIPVNAVISTKMKKIQRANMTNKDNRMKSMNEILDGMKVLKLYAWEPSFQDQVEDIRKTEVDNLKKRSYLSAVQTFMFNASPFFIALATFGTFVLIDPTNVLTAQIAFVSISYFNIIKGPLMQIPSLITQIIQAQVSLERLNGFLNAEETNQNSISHNDEGETVINMDNGSFTWDPELPPTIENVNLKIKKGELVAVVGQVGSGKSSLLSAITGDMAKLGTNSTFNVFGSISYVPQQAWMQNAPLQYNITFGKTYRENTYEKVVDACALRPDLEMLPNGDKTEIGEKGINLSGGQKQRVSLSRAVYNNGDIYLLDDPLSAVDAHVGKHLFDKVIGPKGLLKNKTRVLVTHGVKFLPQVDKILVMKNGSITETGSYKELLDQKGEFADFLVQFISEEEEKPLDKDDLEALKSVKKELVDVIGAEKFAKEFEKAKSKSSVSGHSNISGFSKDTDVSKQLTRSLSGGQGRGRGLGSGRGRGQHGRGLSGGRGMGRGIGQNRESNTEENIGERQALINKVEDKKDPKSNRGEGAGSKRGGRGGRGGWGGSGRLIEEEKVETKSVEKAVYSFYFSAVGILSVISIFILNIFTQGFSIGTNVWLAEWSDDPNSAETSTRNLYLAVYAILGTLSAVTICSSSLITAIGGLNASSKLHDKMLQSILHAPMSFFDTNPKGRIVNRFAKDIDLVDQQIPGTFGGLLRTGVSVVGTLLVISSTNPIIIAIIIPLAFAYWFVQKLYVATSRQLKRIESSTRSPIYSWFGESVSGIATIKAYGLQSYFIKEIEGKVDLNSMCYEPNVIASRWLSIRLEMLGNLIILFAALFAVLGRDTLDPGIVGLSLTYAMQITNTLNMLIRMTSMVENNMVSVERIKEYQSDLPQEAEWKLDADPGSEWPHIGNISFENLEMRYREGLDLVLKGISLDIKGGQKVGVVGRTGAGKSSLTLSLFRINEASKGKILIDSRDISNMGLGTLRSRLTIIPQDPVLFSGSIRLNLDPFNSYTTEAIWDALELSHLKSYISALPGGLDHVVSEGGDNLSVGQRQLVCLARALLRKSRILVLDEATAAIDLETDDLIQETIRQEFKSSTIVTIAHRLNTILDSDVVIVLSDGLVKESGHPQRLLEDTQSAFYAMAKEAGIVKIQPTLLDI